MFSLGFPNRGAREVFDASSNTEFIPCYSGELLSEGEADLADDDDDEEDDNGGGGGGGDKACERPS